MSKINITELNNNQSQLKAINETEQTTITGGRRRIRNRFSNSASILQVNNFVSIQFSFGEGSSNITVASLTNNAGVNQIINI